MNSPRVCDWVFEHARRTPDSPAIASPEYRLTYGELARRIRVLSRKLVAAGLGRGDPLVIALPNLPVTVIASLSAMHLGAVCVEINREWGLDALDAVFEQTQARHAIMFGRDARAWAKLRAAPRLAHLFIAHPTPLPAALAATFRFCPCEWLPHDGPTDAEPLDAADIGDPEGIVGLVYTSGSTGRPQAVIQSARNLAANACSIVQYLGLGSADRAMLILPLFYCYGKSVLNTHLLVGGSVFLDNRFMYPNVVLRAIGEEGCTGFAGVPLTFELLRRSTSPHEASMPRLRYLTQAGGPMHPDTIDWVRAAFHPARLFVMYGQTEATARLSYLPPERAADKRGSIGVLIPGVELRVVDDDGTPLGPGERGHLVARGENVCAGYYRAPEETARILRDGWLWTGDIAYVDADGFFFLVGRTKEIIKIGGHRVSPVEIEQLICTHPGVVDAGATSIPDALLGEALACVVVAKEGRTLSAADVRRYFAERAPMHLVPKEVLFVRALPRSSAGKLLRAELSALARQQLAQS